VVERERRNYHEGETKEITGAYVDLESANATAKDDLEGLCESLSNEYEDPDYEVHGENPIEGCFEGSTAGACDKDDVVNIEVKLVRLYGDICALATAQGDKSHGAREIDLEESKE